MTRKLLSIAIALLMVLSLVPMSALAKENVEKTPGLDTVFDRGSKQKITSSTKIAEAPTRDDVVLTNLLLEENWDGENLNNDGWWMYNADGNSFTYNNSTIYNNWVWSTVDDYAYSGTDAMMSYSYIGSARNQDNWLCTPDLAIPTTGYYLSYYARSANASWLDHLQIMIGEYGVAYDDSTITPGSWVSAVDLYEVPAEYSQVLVDLSAYAGKTISIAFRHVDYDELAVILDDVAVGLGDSSSLVNDTGITISDTTKALELTYAYQLTATVTPADATFTDVTWTTSNPSIVAVNNVGGIMAMGVGTATVTATSHSGYTATCTVTVTEGEYCFEDNLVAYTLFDIDNSAATDNWYSMDRFGTAQLLASGDGDLLVSEYNYGDGLLYGYEELSDESVNFVSFDPNNNYAKTVIATNIDVMPEWMAYDYQNNVMYGAFYYQDSSSTVHFDIAEVNLTSGLEGTVLSDIYNAPYDDDENWELTPTLGTYYYNGMFLIYYGGYVLLMHPNYNGEGLAIGMLDNELKIADQLSNVANYYQKMWFNPNDGMLYWATIFGYNCTMVITDVATGVSVATGITGVSGASSGMEVTALFVPAAPVVTHTVSFYDSLTNELIATVTVNDGEDAEAPEPPVHEGYTFAGWDIAFTNVTEDLKVYALYTENPPAGLLGDVNLDNVVDMLDVSDLNAFLVNVGTLPEGGLANGDVNGDGLVDAYDSTLIAMIALGITLPN